MKRSYWLDLFTWTTWQEFQKAGCSISGFRESRWKTIQKIQVGDYLLCYYATSLGLIAARQGDTAKAMEVSEWLKSIKLPYLYGEPTYSRACIAAILGDKEEAVALLKESFLQGKTFSIDVHRDFDFESLWDYPPFVEFLKPKG